MPRTFTLHIELACGESLEVPVTRKRVRNLNLRFSNGKAQMSVPVHTSTTDARAFLERHTRWLDTRVRLQRERAMQTPQNKPVLDLETEIPLWGAPIKLRDALNAAGMNAHASARPTEFDQDAFNELLKDLYRHEVMNALSPVANALEQTMGVRASHWTVRSMRTRWGSCTPKTGRIRIALELAAYPPACLEMVVAHELVHLMEPSHNQRFHTLLDIYCPENHGAAKRLKQPPLTQHH